MSDLLKQMQDECSIDDKSGFQTAGNSEGYTEDIEQRLDKLKGREPKAKSSGQPTYDYDSDDEAEFRKRYIQQVKYLSDTQNLSSNIWLTMPSNRSLVSD
jgi:hypothetical protein